MWFLNNFLVTYYFFYGESLSNVSASNTITFMHDRDINSLKLFVESVQAVS